MRGRGMMVLDGTLWDLARVALNRPVLDDLAVWHMLLITVTALGTQIIGGLAGYGTGLLMPLVLVPILGPAAIVPVISVSAVLTNATRAFVFRDSIDWHRALLIGVFGLPTTILGAHFYTLLSSQGAALVIGVVLLAVIPLRRWVAGLQWKLGMRGGAVAGIVYGFITGGSTGVGVLLLAIFMAMGLSGKRVIATDAMATIVLGLAKVGMFSWAGVLPSKLWVVALLIGLMAMPGAMLARWLADRFSARLHDTLIEGAIAVGGAMLIWRALRTAE